MTEPALAGAGAAAPDTDRDAVFASVCALIESRQTVLPRRLVAPGPNAEQLQALLTLAAAAPDHGQLTPWRFIVVPQGERHRLADAFALALSDRDPAAGPEQLAQAREKAHRAPLLMVAVAALGPREPDIPPLERMVSMGAALQNLLLGAHALGFGAGLTSGQAMSSPHLRRLLALAEGEVAVCCVNIGTATRRSQRLRPRPLPAQFCSALAPASDRDGV
jgi:nitroreductase